MRRQPPGPDMAFKTWGSPSAGGCQTFVRAVTRLVGKANHYTSLYKTNDASNDDSIFKDYLGTLLADRPLPLCFSHAQDEAHHRVSHPFLCASLNQ